MSPQHGIAPGSRAAPLGRRAADARGGGCRARGSSATTPLRMCSSHQTLSSTCTAAIVAMRARLFDLADGRRCTGRSPRRARRAAAPRARGRWSRAACADRARAADRDRCARHRALGGSPRTRRPGGARGRRGPSARPAVSGRPWSPRRRARDRRTTAASARAISRSLWPELGVVAAVRVGGVEER